jgi:Ca-activated chloride channel family protein
MRFAWPALLPALLLVPLLVVGYVLAVRRRRRVAVVHPNVALVRAAAPRRAGWKRHAPSGLLLAALACLLAAGARPQVEAKVPVSSSAVILALDVSGSMCATDVDPNRLTAAQDAVRTFVRGQEDGTRIGLVVFSGFAQLAVPPTTDRKQLLTTIDGLTTGRGTTIGAAILKSVDAISTIDSGVAPSDVNPDGSGGAVPGEAPKSGRYAPEIVVLLTDGANTRGITPLDAAKVAAARGVRVYPIGFGTTNPTNLVCSAAQLGGSGFDSLGPGGFGGGAGATDPRRRGFLVVDEPTLREVADTTGGQYFSATRGEELQAVLKDLPRHVEVQDRDIEITAGLAGLAGLLLLLGMGAAARWTTFPG